MPQGVADTLLSPATVTVSGLRLRSAVFSSASVLFLPARCRIVALQRLDTTQIGRNVHRSCCALEVAAVELERKTHRHRSHALAFTAARNAVETLVYEHVACFERQIQQIT